VQQQRRLPQSRSRRHVSLLSRDDGGAASDRGRANTLRLALSNQLGADALASDALKETMALCVGCKGCKRECPTGVDMARMKVEFLHHYRKRHASR